MHTVLWHPCSANQLLSCHLLLCILRHNLLASALLCNVDCSPTLCDAQVSS